AAWKKAVFGINDMAHRITRYGEYRGASIQRRAIARPGSGDKTRAIDRNSQSSPFAIVFLIRGIVGNRVLRAQLRGDLRICGLELLQVFDGIDPASGLVGHLAQFAAGRLIQPPVDLDSLEPREQAMRLE